jgi:NAD(P)-dependent dehydrogenase (short-subunit alcohol dehydrogenase family)
MLPGDPHGDGARTLEGLITMANWSGKVMVVGASKGFGRGIAEAFGASGAEVVAVAPPSADLDGLAAAHPDFEVVAADAADPTTAGMLLDRHHPQVLALVAGARPLLRPIHHHSWETFSLNYEVDVRLTFNWLRDAFLLPLDPESVIITTSSAAAIHGSPMSGAYAGAKATIRFISAYAAEESERRGLGIKVVSVVPTLTAATELGHQTVSAYAARLGVTQEQFLQQLGTPVTPATAGRDYVALASGNVTKDAHAYAMTGDGLEPLP